MRDLVDVFERGACINITKVRERYHRLQVVIKEDEGVLRDLQNETGLGRIYRDGWHIESAQAEQLLRMVRPHVRDKKEHIKTALRFRQTYGGTSGQLSGTIQKIRDECMYRLSSLNQGR